MELGLNVKIREVDEGEVARTACGQCDPIRSTEKRSARRGGYQEISPIHGDRIAGTACRSGRVFCDGLLMANEPCSGALLKNQEPLLIGAETNDGKVVRHFYGELEEAALWSRALSDKEIALLSHSN